jgi:hypothetical protein
MYKVADTYGHYAILQDFAYASETIKKNVKNSFSAK